MRSAFEILTWILRKAGTASVEHLVYCINNPIDACRDLWDWMKNNKLTCAMILSGVLVIAIPPAIGFSAIGPVAGSIAAGWQSTIGNVVAGSLFAVIQSMSMTGVFTGIGAGIIGTGMTLCLTTRDWKSILPGLIQSYMRDHRQVLCSSLATICEMRLILSRIDMLARNMAVGKHTLILALVNEINRLFERMEEIKEIHTLMQRLDAAISRDAPEDELVVLLPDEWRTCLAFVKIRCAELGEAARSPSAGPELYELVEELEGKASELLQMRL